MVMPSQCIVLLLRTEPGVFKDSSRSERLSGYSVCRQFVSDVLIDYSLDHSFPFGHRNESLKEH